MSTRFDIWIGEVLWLIDMYRKLIQQGGNISDLRRYNDRISELEDLWHDMQVDTDGD